jgi:beta-phosphoglucomutase
MPDLKIAFLFDMDGTLADTMPFHLRAWIALLGERGIQVEPEAFLRQTAGQTNREICDRTLGLRLTDAELADFEERKESAFRDLCRPHLAPIAGLRPFLDASRNLSIPLAVATSACRANRDLVLEGLGLAPYFAAVVGVEEIQRGKPDPEIFLKAADRLGVEPGGCLVFEDALTGVEAASRAGMRAVALATILAPAEFEGRPGVIRVVRDYAGLEPEELIRELVEPAPDGLSRC